MGFNYCNYCHRAMSLQQQVQGLAQLSKQMTLPSSAPIYFISLTAITHGRNESSEADVASALHGGAIISPGSTPGTSFPTAKVFLHSLTHEEIWRSSCFSQETQQDARILRVPSGLQTTLHNRSVTSCKAPSLAPIICPCTHITTN